MHVFGPRPRQVSASWCASCGAKGWTSLWPILDLPDETHKRVMKYLDAVAVTLAGQSCTTLLMVRAPECSLAPPPFFMSANQLLPEVRVGTLTVHHMGAYLHPFAVRAAELRTMIHQVVVNIRRGWADAEYLHPWVAVEGRMRLERRAARDVLALRVPLAEAASVEYFNQRWDEVVQGLHAHAHRPSSARVPADPKPRPFLHARLRSLAARPKAPAIGVALVPQPPSMPPPDALLASRAARSDSSRDRPRPSRQAEPGDAADF